ncbi:MAG: response regulator [Thermoplasmata archaeon]|nr:response regulator [Thermoplasmata archaeon]
MTIKVLYIDDEKTMADVMKALLEKNEDISVEISLAADEALSRIRDDGFDVIVANYQMPKMDGIELLKAIRGEGNDIPFILLTDRGKENVAIQALNQGADFYAQKSVDTPRMISELSNMILQSYETVVAERSRAELWERYERLAQAIPDLIWRVLIKPEIKVEYMNPASFDWVGYTPEEFYSDAELLFKCIHPEDAAKLRHAFASAEEFKQPLTLRWVKKDGTVLWVEDRWGFIKDESGDVVMIEGVSRNVTERVNNEQALRQANKKLELMTHLIKHDTFNQLNTIIGYADLARKGDPEMVKKANDRIVTASKIIMMQLEFSSSYQETVSGVPVWTSLREVIDSSILAMQKPDVEFVISVNDIEIRSDYALDRVFRNLIEDSITHGGHISMISIECIESDVGYDIIYADNGIGVPLDEKERIFERGFGTGTGYGLFLSREILNVSGMTIKEDGVPGKGARFVIHIPKDACKVSLKAGQ